MSREINVKSILYNSNELSESDSDSTNDNEGMIYDRLMEYKCKCTDSKCKCMMNDNIKCGCDI